MELQYPSAERMQRRQSRSRYGKVIRTLNTGTAKLLMIRRRLFRGEIPPDEREPQQNPNSESRIAEAFAPLWHWGNLIEFSSSTISNEQFSADR